MKKNIYCKYLTKFLKRNGLNTTFIQIFWRVLLQFNPVLILVNACDPLVWSHKIKLTKTTLMQIATQKEQKAVLNFY